MTMRIDIISLHPGLLEGPFQHSIVKRAIDKGLATVVVHDLREYGLGKHRQVDDYPLVVVQAWLCVLSLYTN